MAVMPEVTPLPGTGALSSIFSLGVGLTGQSPRPFPSCSLTRRGGKGPVKCPLQFPCPPHCSLVPHPATFRGLSGLTKESWSQDLVHPFPKSEGSGPLFSTAFSFGHMTRAPCALDTGDLEALLKPPPSVQPQWERLPGPGQDLALPAGLLQVPLGLGRLFFRRFWCRWSCCCCCIFTTRAVCFSCGRTVRS